MKHVALMFQPDIGNGPPTWLVTLWSEVPGYQKLGWFLLADAWDHSLRRAEMTPPLNPPRYIWRLKRPNRGSSGD